jgi:membrane-associated phospholipid phosphatase
MPAARSLYRLLLLGCVIVTQTPAWSDDATLPELATATAATSTNPDTDPPPQRSFGAQLANDAKYILTAPTRWDSRDWMRFGGAAAAIIGTGLIFDRRESDPGSDKENDLTELASKVEPFGAQDSLLTLAGFYAAGVAFDSPREVAVAQDGFTASVIASAIIAPAVKWVVGRVRPADTDSPTDFKPFGRNHSFPSGHTTQAFTVASVIAGHYDSLLIDSTAYTTAALVGYARHEHQAHWSSDIVAGAMLGIAVGRTVVQLNEENRGVHVGVISSDNGPMVALVIPLH